MALVRLESIERGDGDMNARRRVGVSGVVLLTGVALLVTAGPIGAGATNAPAHKGIGALDCGISGKVKFNPPLGATSTPTAVKVKIALNACSGSNAGATVTGGQITGTITGTPAGDCAATAFDATGSLTVTYDVKSGDPRLTPSTLEFNQVQSFGTSDFEGEVTGVVEAGSFFSNGSFLDLQSTQASPCGAKWTTGTTGSFQEG